MGKLSKDRRDIFYQRAKLEGYRARSAYKLLQLDEKFNLFHPKINYVLDLCAAPGSWSQVARQKLNYMNISDNSLILKESSNSSSKDETFLFNSKRKPTIVAVDIQEMAPIEGVEVLKGDITLPETISSICKMFNGHLADLIMSDGAPDITGLHDMDEYIQNQLLLASLKTTIQLLKPGGTFIAKIFRGENISFVYLQLHSLFNNVFCCKPTSSRNASLEAFVVCTDFVHPIQNIKMKKYFQNFDVSIFPDKNNLTQTDEDKSDIKRSQKNHLISLITPFVVCGDLSGFDANLNYDLEESHIFVNPIQPPIDAPYNAYLSTN